MNNIVIILAGGLGKRMNSELPKVCHPFHSIPMIVRVFNESKKIIPTKIFVVVGKYKDIIKKTLEKNNIFEYVDYEFIIQETPLGTGDAVKCCREKLLNIKLSNVLILCGDIPLIDGDIIEKMTSTTKKIKCMTTIYEDPKSYGRIIRIGKIFSKITEFKDCNNEEKLIKEVNCGIYSIKSDLLIKYLPYIDNNNKQNEYYLTDIIEIIKKNENIDIETYIIPPEKQYIVEGVNSKDELLNLEKIYSNL